MKLSHLFALIFSICYASSHEISSDTRVCQEFVIPLNVTSHVFVTKYPAFKDNFDVVGFVDDMARRDSNTIFTPFGVPPVLKNVTASYTIGAAVCIPKGAIGKDQTLLLASHGLGYDRRHVLRTLITFLCWV
jgi:hypothetical protein